MNKAITHVSQRRTVLFIIIICVIPWIVAYGVLKFNWLPAPINKGTFLKSTVTRSSLQLQTLFDPHPQDTHRQWEMLFLVPEKCDRVCHRQIYNLRQIRTATAKHQKRVRFATMTTSQQKAQSKRWRAQYPSMGQHLVSKEAVQKLTQPTALSLEVLLQGRLFIVDPKGNFVFHYTPNFNRRFVHKDLMHLLKASRIG